MILVADSGSTKTDWRLISNQELLSAETIGLNPYFVNEGEIARELSENELLSEYSERIEKVFFYGAGCSSDAMNAIVEKGLQDVFLNAVITVGHDVLGAALAAGKGESCIACILGTGSNACFFDGESIFQETPSLAYILGDEGSGSWFGKQLLRDFLYQNEMPEALRQHLVKKGVDKDSVLNRVYRQDHPNVYLASFAGDLGLFRETEYVQRMLSDGIHEFLSRHVCCYPDHKTVNVNFVGSIAHFFSEELLRVAAEFGINVGNVIRKPIDGMVEYHGSSV